LIAITSSASISSETFIVPNSAATAEPLRPITITAIKTGPISRKSVSITRSGMYISAPRLSREWAACMASVTPTLNAVSATIGAARTPINTICRKIGAILKNCPVNGAIKIQ
jgi:hypothetical protein